MPVRPIVITGEPVLHSPVAPVERVDDELRALVADMVETMHAAPGVGLAAPQVGVPLRVFVWGWTDDDGLDQSGVAINPELWISPPVPAAIDELDDDAEAEGCLSLPGLRFPLRRASEALLRATDLDGAAFDVRASGWLARIFQHEFDHLDGVLYADRLAHPHDKGVVKAVRKKSWGSPGQSWMPGIEHPEG